MDQELGGGSNIESKEQAARHLKNQTDECYDSRIKPRLQEAYDFIANYEPIYSRPGVEPDTSNMIRKPAVPRN